MSKLRISVVSGLILVLAVGAYIFADDGAAPAPGNGPAAEPQAAAVWTCSMHPEINAPKPGLCPKCGMKLVPRTEAAPQTEAEFMKKVSYCIGINIGMTIAQQGIELDMKEVAEGLETGVKKGNPKMTAEEMEQTLMAFQQMMIARQQEAMQKMIDDNKKKSVDYLAANKKKEGVTVLPSGLQYQVVKAGDGKKPKLDDTVRVNYKGTLVDGTIFDSSYKRGVPAEFGVGQVIPGWVEALQLMSEGSKWIIVIPADLAYGDNGIQGAIPPASTLIFEVELIKVLDEKDDADAAPEKGADAPK